MNCGAMSQSIPDVYPVELLYAPCRGVQFLPFARGGDDLQLFPRGKLLLKLLVHLETSEKCPR
jgi:hypothetical protein